MLSLRLNAKSIFEGIRRFLLTEFVPFHRNSWSQGTESDCLGALQAFIEDAETSIYQTQQHPNNSTSGHKEERRTHLEWVIELLQD